MSATSEMPPAGRKWQLRAKRFGIAWAVGTLFWLSVPDTDMWWLGFVMWAAWLWMIEDMTPKQALFYGFISGVSAISVGYFWMTELLLRFAFPPEHPDGSVAWGWMSMPLSVAIHMVFSCWQGAGWGLAAGLLAWLRRRTGVGVLWLAAPCWTVVEAFFPNLFPTYMSLAWCFQPVLIQLAEIGGVTMVTFAMVSFNTALYVVARGWLRTRELSRSGLIALVGWGVGIPLYGVIRMSMVDAQIEEAPKLKFGVVQGNFGIETFRSHRARILSELQMMTARLEQEGAEVAVWGETAYPYAGFTRESTRDFPRGRRRVRRGFSIPLILGAVTRHRDRRKNPYPYNTAWVLHADDTLGDRYDKVYPLLFGEAAPKFIDPDWYTSTIPNASHLNAGEEPGTMRVDEWVLGPLICYEDILPRYVRATANQGVHVLVNMTNDSWFGKTREQHEHLGLAVFRAVEHRKGLLRSVNAGVSVYVDPAGRVVHETEVTDSDTEGYDGAVGFVAEVPMMDPDSRTLYGLTGEAFNILLGVGLFGLAWRRRKDTELPATPSSSEPSKPSTPSTTAEPEASQTDEETP